MNTFNDEVYKIVKSIPCGKVLTYGDIAKKLGYHEKYLSSTIHSITGMNFRTFLSLYRIDCAKKMLLSSHCTISEIANQCGFSSINTFNRMFLKIANETPSEFKQKSIKL